MCTLVRSGMWRKLLVILARIPLGARSTRSSRVRRVRRPEQRARDQAPRRWRRHRLPRPRRVPATGGIAGDDLGGGASRFPTTRPPREWHQELPDGTPHHLTPGRIPMGLSGVAAPGPAVLPALADGVELISQSQGSGYRTPPALVRRADGQVIQLTQLLYLH